MVIVEDDHAMAEAELRALDDNLWCLENEVKLAGLSFHGKMSVIRSGANELLLYSPVPIDDRIAASLAELGSVTAIVAPNAYHHLFAGDAKRRYPEARLFMSAALERKRDDLARVGEVMRGGSEIELLGDEITALAVAGMPKIEEIVVFHRPSGTLIAADLIMNVHEARGIMTRWLWQIEGVWRKMAMPRLFRFLVKERSAMRDSVGRLLDWPVRRIVPTHGEVVPEDGRKILRECFAWV